MIDIVSFRKNLTKLIGGIENDMRPFDSLMIDELCELALDIYAIESSIERELDEARI